MRMGISFPGKIPRAFWLMVVVLFFADLWTKAWAWDFAAHGPVEVVDGWLAIQKVTNPGGIFGLGQGLRIPLTLLRSAAVVFLFLLAGRQDETCRLGVPTLGLLTAGAMGNLWDNLSSWAPWAGNGEVRDFIRIDLGPGPEFWPGFLPWPFHPWPLFNLADSCISIGFLLLITGLARIRLQAPDGGKDLPRP